MPPLSSPDFPVTGEDKSPVAVGKSPHGKGLDIRGSRPSENGQSPKKRKEVKTMKNQLEQIVANAILAKFDIDQLREALCDAVYIDYDEVAENIIARGYFDITEIILDNLDALL